MVNSIRHNYTSVLHVRIVPREASQCLSCSTPLMPSDAANLISFLIFIAVSPGIYRPVPKRNCHSTVVSIEYYDDAWNSKAIRWSLSVKNAGFDFWSEDSTYILQTSRRLFCNQVSINRSWPTRLGWWHLAANKFSTGN